MAVIGELRTLITAQTTQMESAMGRVERRLARYEKLSMRAKAATSRLNRAMVAMGRGAATAAAGFLSLRAAITQTADSVRLFAREQSSQAVFQRIFGGTSGADLTSGLRQLAVTTPFQLTELREATQLISVYTENVGDVLPRIRMLGELAAGANVPMLDLARTFARNSQLTIQQTRDLREWGNRGIPIVKEMARMWGVNESAVLEMASSSEISFKDVERALANLTTGTGLFARAMETRSKTIEGKLSNMQDAVDNVKTAFGELVVEATGLDNILSGVTSKLDRIATKMRGDSITPVESRQRLIEQLQNERRNLATNKPEFVTNAATGLEAVGEPIAMLADTVSAVFGGEKNRFRNRLASAIGPLRQPPTEGRLRRAEIDEQIRQLRSANTGEREATEPGRLASTFIKGLAGGAAKRLRGIIGMASGFEGIGIERTAAAMRDRAIAAMDEGGRRGAAHRGSAARDVFAGAAIRGSAAEQRILRGNQGRAIEKETLSESKKHTKSLASIDVKMERVIGTIADAIPTPLSSFLEKAF